ncbi:MAG: division/cell wall cluster transcriptional repressor MraZ [Planctomycetota bacterium]|nr:division/cell wall cluster transcriptional repressor MraZ [Planctomycetota bacterium]
MLLTGTYRRTLDDKLRLSVPKQLRELLTDCNLFLTPGTDKALFVYTGETLEGIGDMLSNQSPAAKETRAFSRLFYAQAQPADIDKQGRLRLTLELSELAGLENEVVIVGVRDRLEIWNAVSWDAFLVKSQPSYDELAEQVFANAISDLNTNDPKQTR